MNLTLLNALEWGSYLIVLVSAIYVSWKGGEKEGSRFMLQYLREEKFLDATGYNKFMMHIREEEKKGDEDLSDKD